MTTPTTTAPTGTYENRGERFDVPVMMKASQYALACILITTFESGYSNTWCRDWKVATPAPGLERYKDEVYNEWCARTLAHGGTLTITEVLDDGPVNDEDVACADHVLTREKLLAAIATWARLGRARTEPDGDLDTGDIDGPQADLILQYAVLGEERYC